MHVVHIPILTSAITLSASSGALWGAAIAAPLGTALASDVRVAAGAASVIAAMCWLVRGARCRADDRERMHLRNEGELIRTLAEVTRPPAARRATLPLRRVR